ncbi:N/A [soil metagenome]
MLKNSILKRIFIVLSLFALAPSQAMEQVNTFSPVTKADLPMLFEWFQQPYIAELWKEPKDFKTFETKYLKQISTQYIIPFIAYIGNNPVAYIQYHHTNAEGRALVNDFTIPEKSVGFDLFIGNPEYLNKGHGTKLLKEFIAFVKTQEPECQAIVIDPATDNDRAIACYKKAGFSTIGTYIVPWGPTGDGPGPVLMMIYYY